jgi:hypothetical protein
VAIKRNVERSQVTTQTDFTDALGYPIVIGGIYGYSTNDGGWARTTVGKAINVTPKGKVTLDELEVRRYLYGEQTEYEASAKTVSIRSHMVFPVKVEK